MNEVPPNPDQPDDVDEHYRRVSALDPSRPGKDVRRAVLAHAAQVAADHRNANTAAVHSSLPPRARRVWRGPAIFGTLAAAAVAGLLIFPRLQTPHAPPTESDQSAQLSGSTPAASSSVLAPATTVKSVPMPPPVSPPAQLQRSRAQTESSNKPSSTSARDMGTMASGSGASAKASANQSPVAVSPHVASAERSEPAAPPAAATQSAPATMAPPAESALKESVARARSSGAADGGATAELRRAAEIGDRQLLQTLLDEGVDVDSRDAAGRTALMLATLHGRADAVSVLLSYGADPNAADSNGVTPLQAAMAEGNQAIIAALKSKGAR